MHVVHSPDATVHDGPYPLVRIPGQPRIASLVQFERFPDDRSAVRAQALASALDACVQAEPGVTCWLLVREPEWDGETPRRRHLGFWRVWAPKEASGRRFEETSEREGLVRRSGALEVDASGAGWMQRFVVERRGAFLLALRGAQPLAQLGDDWFEDEPRHVRIARLAAQAVSLSALLVQPFGYFDDPEVGAAVFGEPSKIEAVARELASA